MDYALLLLSFEFLRWQLYHPNVYISQVFVEKSQTWWKIGVDPISGLGSHRYFSNADGDCSTNSYSSQLEGQLWLTEGIDLHMNSISSEI